MQQAPNFLNYQYLETHMFLHQKRIFKNFISGPNAVVPNLPHPIPKKTADGTHAFVGLSDYLANELAKATPFDNFYFESYVQFLPKDIPTLSTTPSAYKLFFNLKEDDYDQYILYLWYKE